MLSLISFIITLRFSEYSSSASLGRFIPSYFVLFVAVVNGIVSLISLSDLSLLVYRNVIYLCVLNWHLANLTIALTSSVSFLAAYLWIGEGNGTPLQYSCLENPMNGGAW